VGELKLYVVLHTHAHGVTTYLVKSDRFPTQRQVIRCLDIDYEPHKAENLEIGDVPENEPITLDWQESDILDPFEDDPGEEPAQP
jgi:hypothetical protein